ncbi:hypothetical protein Pla110_03970 [Polystyrenella longa]|uniref:Uncharacterized protein n=1 Tax=Polystyrenella longa TaxID=2528007 RepID=A0A518CHJ1_9PLAN|nr:hypothetical protein [Polystyrenella longa]QDU78693.1 hypothetical protein Pla110_03970 [Polystyrenella longa]
MHLFHSLLSFQDRLKDCSFAPLTLFVAVLFLGDFFFGPANGFAEEKAEESLHNLKKITLQYYSGAEPVGEAAFQQLKEMGVKVIISVDGIRPNVELARKYGIRYVHIPVQYSGIDRGAELSLVRAAKEIDEPVYVHCHHGKHRGPAAMAILCQAAEVFDGKQAEQFLQEAGTSPQYKGLWKSVREFQPPATSEELPPLEETAEVDSVASHMAEADRRFDHLTAFLEATEDMTPEIEDQLNGETLLLWELIRESRRTVALDKSSDAELVTAFEESDLRLKSIKYELKTTHSRATWLEKLNEIKRDCKACHAQFRN